MATTGVLVQARLSSTRLPGKVLRPFGGVPLIGHLLDRLEQAQLADVVVVCTSDRPDDDPLAQYCGTRRIPLYRGPLEDVAGRLLGAAREHGIDVVVRVCADSPLLDPTLVDRVVQLFEDQQPDVATNVFPRSFPVGQSVEVVATDVLGGEYPRMNAYEVEHVLPYFYRRTDRFRVVNMSSEVDASSVRMCVDTADDAQRIDQVLRTLPEPPASYSLDDLLNSFDWSASQEPS